MKLLCLGAVVVLAVLSTPANAHSMRKRSLPGSWAIADENAVDNAVYQLPNGGDLAEAVQEILVAADALPRNYPALIDAIFAAVVVAINSIDYYYYNGYTEDLNNLFYAIEQLSYVALNNPGSSILAKYAQEVIAASQAVACTNQCGTFTSTTFVNRLESDAAAGTTLAIINDIFLLPQVAISAFAIHQHTPIAFHVVTLLSDINALIVVCYNQNTNALANAIQTVLVDANAIGAVV